MGVFLKIIFIFGITVWISACGGGSASGSGEGDGSTSPKIGVFIDSPVSSMGYRTETLEGSTNSLGEYQYLEGESVTFFIGELEFPTVTAKAVVTPLDLANTESTNNQTVVNIIRLLQSLDSDGDPENGITISGLADDYAPDNLDWGASESIFELEVNILVINAGFGGVLVDAEEAISHFESSLNKNFSIDLTGLTATSEITYSECPNIPGGLDYSFYPGEINLYGSDSWQASGCILNAFENKIMYLSELNQQPEFVFSCIDYPICVFSDFEREVAGLNSDGRAFTSTFTFDRSNLTITALKEFEDGSFTETINIWPQDLTLATDNEYWVSGHSLFTYLGGDAATATTYTNVGNWLGLFAGENGVESRGGFTFGFTDAHAAYDWTNLANVPLSGVYTEGNTSTFDTGGDGMVAQDLDRFLFMPSNYLESDVGRAPFTGSEETYQAVVEDLITDVQSQFATAEPILYVHLPDSGPYGTYPLNSTQFATFISDTLGSWMTFHTAVQDGLVSAGHTDVKTCPVYPTWLYLVQNEAYLSGTTFDDYFGDSAPHGQETAYFLSALVLYRCIYQSNPDLSGFSYPSGTSIITEVTSNLSSIITGIESRLNYYNTNGVRVY